MFKKISGFLACLKSYLFIFANATNTSLTPTTEADFFNVKYNKKIYATFYKNFPYFGIINKTYSSFGRVEENKVQLSFGGSTGFGTLPTAMYPQIDELDVTPKNLYARLFIDGPSWERSKGSDAAMEEVSKFEIRTKMMSLKRTLEEHFAGNGTGEIGTGDGTTPTGSAAAPVIKISTATFKRAKWQLDMIINVGSATDNYKVTAVNDSTRAITLSRLDGSVDLTSGAFSSVCYLQGSKDVAIQGWKGVINSTGTIYGIPTGKNWISWQEAAAGASVTPALLQKVVLNIDENCGESPNLIVAPVNQYNKLLAYNENLARFDIAAKAPVERTTGSVRENDKYLSTLSYSGVALATDRGTIPIISNRFIDSDTVYLLNTDYIEFRMTEKGIHLKDQDGTVFLRDATTDAYEGRAAVYCEHIIIPPYQGQITGLSTT